MQLTISDRVIFEGILPQEGNRLTFKALTEIRSKVGFSADELEEYQIEPVGNSIKWNVPEGKDGNFDIDFTAGELKIIKDSYLKLDSEGRITAQLFDLGEKFMEEE